MLGDGFGQDFGNLLAPNGLVFGCDVDDRGVLVGGFAFACFFFLHPKEVKI